MQVFSAQLMQSAGVAEDNVIGEAGHRLDLAAHQERVLLRDQQTAVEGNLRPAARGQQGVVKRAAICRCELRRGFDAFEASLDVERMGESACGAAGCAGFEREAAAGEPGQGHADHAADDSAVKAVAGVFCFARAAFDPACAAACFVGGGEIFLRERLAGAQQFEDGLAELRAGGPGFVDARAGEHVG